MKNRKASVKLLVSFLIIILLTCTIAATAYIGMQNISQSNQQLYSNNVIGLELLGRIILNFQEQNVLLRNFLLFDNQSNAYADNKASLSLHEQSMRDHIALYTATVSNPQEQAQFKVFTDRYYTEFADLKASMALQTSPHIKGTAPAESTSASLPTLYSELLRLANADNNILQDLEKCYALNVQNAHQSVEKNKSLLTISSLLQIGTLLLCVITAIAIAAILNHALAKPMVQMADVANEIANGNMNVTVNHEQTRDEAGRLAEAFQRMISTLKVHADVLFKIAQGDLTADIPIGGKNDVIGQSLHSVSDMLHRVIHEISSFSTQASLTANQISLGSQALTQGTVEQASAIRLLSRSVSEISHNTRENVSMAEAAASLYIDMKKRAQEGAELMNEMLCAVDEINQATANISKIIKLINDISFQTNILSLNAAVEAANAGQHGKGFAVVAGEVRNLAVKSSQAAADTDILIEDSISKAHLGVSIAQKVHHSLGEISADILHSSKLIDDITRLSQQQTLGIEHINLHIEQVAQVVKNNRVTAEQSALAAEEMALQAAAADRLVSGFAYKHPESDHSALPVAHITSSTSAPLMASLDSLLSPVLQADAQEEWQ